MPLIKFMKMSFSVMKIPLFKMMSFRKLSILGIKFVTLRTIYTFADLVTSWSIESRKLYKNGKSTLKRKFK